MIWPSCTSVYAKTKPTIQLCKTVYETTRKDISICDLKCIISDRKQVRLVQTGTNNECKIQFTFLNFIPTVLLFMSQQVSRIPINFYWQWKKKNTTIVTPRYSSYSLFCWHVKHTCFIDHHSKSVF